ncbi:MAG: hypothetical protein JSU05_11715, partial [Bacteroidetes bacterium]|nr:hypothetical protein [Bacteroidota bacterium]
LTTTGNTNTGGSVTRVATSATGFPSSLDKNIYQQMSYDQVCQQFGIPK